MCLNAHIESTRDGVMYGMYMREKNWDGKMEENEMAGHVALLTLMKNVCTKSI